MKKSIKNQYKKKKTHIKSYMDKFSYFFSALLTQNVEL